MILYIMVLDRVTYGRLTLGRNGTWPTDSLQNDVQRHFVARLITKHISLT